MTELEKLQRAQMYIDKMANGLNPITDESVEDDDMINNVRISRCLFYVSEILSKVIENEGVIQPHKRKRSRQPFFITDEQKLLQKANDNNCYVSDIANEINRVTYNNVTRLMQAAWINSWLVDIGLLEIIEGKKHATEQGNEIGISTELCYSHFHGDYYKNLFSPSAQTFIFDNVDSTIAFHYNQD